MPAKCRVFCKIEPANNWGWHEILVNKANYYLETLAWQKTKDGQKKLPQHKPRPFVPEFMGHLPQANGPVARDVEAHTTEDIKEILSRPRA